MYLLDSNIVSFITYRPEDFPLLVRNIKAVNPADRWISVVTAQELIAYKYEQLHNTINIPRNRLLKFYGQLDLVLRVVSTLQMKPFTPEVYDAMSGMPGNVDVFDRRIAATAIYNDFVMVSHNGDFKEIKKARPELQLVDWVDEDHT